MVQWILKIPKILKMINLQKEELQNTTLSKDSIQKASISKRIAT